MSDSPYMSLNEVAKLTGRAKSTISKALKSGKMSYVSKDERSGAYEIDPAEAERVFPRKQETAASDHIKNTDKTHGNSALSVEVKMLREQIERGDLDRNREREQLSRQVEILQEQIERQSADHRQALAVITDQREQPKAKFKWIWQR